MRVFAGRCENGANKPAGLKDEKNSIHFINDILDTFKIPAVETRQKKKQQKRKRGDEEKEEHMKIDATPLDELFIDGLNDDQIYHQLDLRAKVMCDLVERLVDASDSTDIPDEDDIEGEEEEEEDVDLDDLSPEEIEALKAEGLLDDDASDDDEDNDSSSQSASDDENDPTIGEISYQKLNDHDQDSSDEEEEKAKKGKKGTDKSPKTDVWGLDDAFFSIDDFNKMTEDQEVSERLRRRAEDDEDSEEEEDVDIFSAEAAAQLENDDENANDVYFNDFFAPPRKGWSHSKLANYSLADPQSNAKKDKKNKVKEKKEKKEKRRSSVRFDDSVKVQKIKNKSG